MVPWVFTIAQERVVLCSRENKHYEALSLSRWGGVIFPNVAVSCLRPKNPPSVFLKDFQRTIFIHVLCASSACNSRRCLASTCKHPKNEDESDVVRCLRWRRWLTLGESNMAWWKMDHRNQRFSKLETSIQFGDFPASHVWLPEGQRVNQLTMTIFSRCVKHC